MRTFFNCFGDISKTLTVEEEKHFLNTIHCPSSTCEAKEEALATLVQANLRLVIWLAEKQRSIIPTEDLVSEGIIGLLTAIYKFDNSYTNKFSTYAIYWIIESINAAINEKDTVVRIPTYMKKIWYKLSRLRQDTENPQTLTLSEISKHLGCSDTELQNLLKAELACSEYARDEITLNQIEDENNPFRINEIEKVKCLVREIVAALPRRHRYIIRRRFRMNGYENRNKSREAIGKDLRVSRETVRKLELEAYRIIKEKINHHYRSIENLLNFR